MWRVTKTAEQKIGVQFAVHPVQRLAHSSPWQAPLRFIINNNAMRLDGPFSSYRPRAIYKPDDTQRAAQACRQHTRPLPHHSRGHTCHPPFPAATTWGSCPIRRETALMQPRRRSAPALPPSSSPLLAVGIGSEPTGQAGTKPLPPLLDRGPVPLSLFRPVLGILDLWSCVTLSAQEAQSLL